MYFYVLDNGPAQEINFYDFIGNQIELKVLEVGSIESAHPAYGSINKPANQWLQRRLDMKLDKMLVK